MKKICEEKGISIWRLEKDLGFSNRSVSKWNESEPGIRKVQKVADYLGMTSGELMKWGGENHVDSKKKIEDPGPENE